jgi:hypothetical protein
MKKRIYIIIFIVLILLPIILLIFNYNNIIFASSNEDIKNKTITLINRYSWEDEIKFFRYKNFDNRVVEAFENKELSFKAHNNYINTRWINNPTHIIAWDTDTWRHEYPIDEWMRKWGRMDYRTIIIETPNK